MNSDSNVFLSSAVITGRLVTSKAIGQVDVISADRKRREDVKLILRAKCQVVAKLHSDAGFSQLTLHTMLRLEKLQHISLILLLKCSFYFLKQNGHEPKHYFKSCIINLIQHICTNEYKCGSLPQFSICLSNLTSNPNNENTFLFIFFDFYPITTVLSGKKSA